MHKRFGWTMTELVIALIFIMVISAFLVSTFKPNQQNNKINYFAATRNIQKGVISVKDKYAKIRKTNKTSDYNYIFFENPDIKAAGKDTFCIEIADAYALKNNKSINCDKTTSSDTPNIVFDNGVEVYGLASDPVPLFYDENVYTESIKYSYKNIMVDIDGSKGKSRLGIDRFPLRIFAGDNLVLPVNCAETTIYSWKLEGIKGEVEGETSGIFNATNERKNPYCGTSTQNFLLDTEIITFDTYHNVKQEDGKLSETDEMILNSKSFAETVCSVYGGKRYLSESDCSALSYSINSKCEDTENSVCYFEPHRPVAAMSAIVKGIMGGDLDME